MSDAKLSGSLPKGDANGNDTGEIVPTARLRRVEVVLAADLPSAQRLMERALEKRTGRPMLPIDLEDDIRAAFGRVDPRTGEKLDGDDA